MKRTFYDFLIIVGGLFLVSYIYILIQTDFKFRGWSLATIYAIFYGFICFMVFSFTIRLFKSKFAFCAASWVVFFLFLEEKLKIIKTGGTYYQYGHYMYTKGKMTEAGFVNFIQNPVTYMAIFATIWLVYDLVKNLLKRGFKSKNERDKNG